MTRSRYWDCEHGWSRPPRAGIERIATVLQLDVTELLVLAGYVWPGSEAADE